MGKKFPSARTTIITKRLLFYRHASRMAATVKFNTVYTHTHTHKILLSIGEVYTLYAVLKNLLPIPAPIFSPGSNIARSLRTNFNPKK